MNRAKKEALKHPEKHAPPELNIVFRDTPEKFRPMADEILPPLIGLLRSLCALEEEMHARDIKLRASRPGGIYSTEMHPDTPALWQEYKDRYHALLDPHCTARFLAGRRDCCQCMGDPADFSGLNRGGTVEFTMKSPAKAVVMVAESKSGSVDCRFDLRPEGGAWKIDKAAYRFLNDPKWHTEHYM